MAKILKFPTITPFERNSVGIYDLFPRNEVKQIMSDYNIPESLALELVYLRQRSRWTEEVEKRIVRCFHKTGKLNFHIHCGEEKEMLARYGY